MNLIWSHVARNGQRAERRAHSVKRKERTAGYGFFDFGFGIADFGLQKTVGPNSGCVLRGARCALRVADSRISGFALALMIGRIIWGSVKLQIIAENYRNFNGAKSFDK